nr:pentatricopeptide repeat-containing protein [Quercus suber]
MRGKQAPTPTPTPNHDSDLLVSSFKDWFKRRNNALLDQIFLILNTQQLHNDSDDLSSRRSADLALSQLNLRLSESFVLDVLNYGKGRGNDVLSSLKFFDWAGRQPGFHHTRATFHVIFKILSKAQLMSLLLDFLDDYMKQRYLHKVRFYDTLVMGYAVAAPTPTPTPNHDSDLLVSSFKDWFKRRNNALLDQIFLILNTQQLHNDSDDLSSRRSADLALSQLNLRLSESFVLDVLNYGKGRGNDVLSSLKFFDWAGRQPGFHHTRATFHAIFKILSKAQLMSLLLDFLDDYMKQRYLHKNALSRSFCKRKLFHDAELYLRGLLTQGRQLHGHVVTVLVDALCKTNQFQKAGKLVQEFRDSGLVPMEDAYGVWIRDLVQAGQLDGALDFLRAKKSLEGYVPDVFRYNVLICSLLRENRLQELCDLLMEMKEGQISPDMVTMNAALCFFCKAGMVDVALELYNLRSEFGLSPSSMAYNYLINTLCGDGSVDEAYRVLKNSIEQGYFPRGRTFSILADALCREGKLDKMKELVIVALERNFMPTTFSYDKFISALCRARRVEDGYLIHGELDRINKVSKKTTYFNLIHGFNKSNRGDIAARLLIEMQARGHTPTRALFRAVICCLCDMEYPENQFFKLLEMQLSRHESNVQIYNFFIDGAGHAKKPDLAREVFEMMRRSGIEPTLSSDILMLQSYLKSERISDVLNFFSDIRQRRKIKSKLYNTIIVGLSKVNKVDIALEFLRESRNNGVVPGTDCYEVLILMLCSNKRYDMVINLINDLEKTGRHVTSFIGNTLLLHSLKTQDLYDTWVHLKEVQNDKSSDSSLLGLLIGAFSGRVRVSHHVKYLEEVIEKCFPLDIYTYNMLLRRLSMSEMDLACELFNQMCQRGFPQLLDLNINKVYTILSVCQRQNSAENQATVHWQPPQGGLHFAHEVGFQRPILEGEGLFVPTKSDALVIGFRKWLNKCCDGQVDWRGKYMGVLPPTPREQLVDRLPKHVSASPSSVLGIKFTATFAGVMFTTSNKWLIFSNSVIKFSVTAVLFSIYDRYVSQLIGAVSSIWLLVLLTGLECGTAWVDCRNQSLLPWCCPHEFSAVDVTGIIGGISTSSAADKDTLKSPPPESQTMKKVLTIAIIVMTLFYLCCGSFKYAAFGNLHQGTP